MISETSANPYKPRPVVKKIIRRSRTDQTAGINQINLLHFPQRPVAIDTDVEFIVQKNNGKGDIEVRLLSPTGRMSEIPLRIIDFDRLAVRFKVEEIGDHYVHVKYTGKPIVNSPFPLVVEEQTPLVMMRDRESDATQVKALGMALKRIQLLKINEFRVDASEAGLDLLMVGIYGPSGNIEELTVRHLGNGLYVVSYYPIIPGQYVISIKWGSEDVPGSPYLAFAS